MPSLIVLTDFQGLVPQRLLESEGLDLAIIGEELCAHGLTMAIHSYEDLGRDPSLADAFTHVLYASSQVLPYKDAILDHLVALNYRGKKLLPPLEQFHAHENKGFQALFLHGRSFPVTAKRMVTSVEEGMRALREIGLPAVMKTSFGWGSRGVALITSERQGLWFLIRNMVRKPRFWGHWLKRRPYFTLGLGKVLIDQFIPDLDHDWKVLFADDVYAALHRRVREHDFRASGSGRSEFIEAPPEVLEFARTVRRELGLGWGALDILVKDDVCYICEFQTVHFGLYTAVKAPFHYRDQDGAFIRCDGPMPIDAGIGRSIAKQMLSNPN